MKIQVFDYIDSSAKLLEKNRDLLTLGAVEIEKAFTKLLSNSSDIASVSHRIKGVESLKEKIVRSKLYSRWDTPQELIEKISDLIGIRIECRFIAEEKLVYEELFKVFDCKSEEMDGYFYNKEYPNICIKLADKQPQSQRNGLEIFRIDGFIELYNNRFNFELQIKSLVNSFWSEIEHKIIYKNKRYMIIDNFVSELMNSTYQSLINIDSQLQMLYSRATDVQEDKLFGQIERVMVVIINEFYSRMTESSIGFSVNIKDYTDSLVKYLFRYSSFSTTLRKGEVVGQTISDLLERLRVTMGKDIGIGDKIEFNPPFEYKNNYQKIIGEKILSEINSDFNLNTFFHILFSLEIGTNVEDFQRYLTYYEMMAFRSTKKEKHDKIIEKINSADGAKMLLEKFFISLAEL